jgi:hypothetical protein
MKIMFYIFLMAATLLAAPRAEARPAQSQNLPESVTRLFKAKGLDKLYAFSYHLNPFYLRGDFNGDGKADIAILVRQIKAGKIGIAICHLATNEVFLAGAGTEMGKGGDNFDWMDYWYVRPKAGAGKTGRGESLYVGKTESASGMIYWNGKGYAWNQQGD